MNAAGGKGNQQAVSNPVPFLKWAGGKRWFTQSCRDVFPDKFRCYIEPFLGSGAVFFSINPSKAVLSDINDDLINAYRIVQWRRNLLFDKLIDHHRRHSDEYYYSTRATRPTDKVARAARFIYLNRTCWNGLYRVNKSGEFNVPKGTKSKVLLETDDFLAVSRCLAKAELMACDFELSIAKAGTNDLVFLDPPYTVKHNHNGFIKYNNNLFSWEDQIRLANAVKSASKRGAYIVMTNANHDSIRELYKGFHLISLTRHSVLSGKAKARIKTEELLVRNF